MTANTNYRTPLSRTGRYQLADIVSANIRKNGKGLWRPAAIVDIIDDDTIRVAGLSLAATYKDGGSRAKFDGLRAGIKGDGYVFGGRLVMLKLSSGDVGEVIGRVYTQMADDIINATDPDSLNPNIVAAFKAWAS